MTPDDVRAGLGLWPGLAGARVTLLNISENHTFRLDPPRGEPVVLRVHRPGYQSAATIESELQWLETLRRETPLRVPRPLPGSDGRLLQRLGDQPDDRHAVLFAFEPGAEPTPDGDLGDLFETLGRMAATTHSHAVRFEPPTGFDRQVWTAAAILDGTGPWGDWRAAPGLYGETLTQLASLGRRLRAQLGAYGTRADRFGLIHADMRLANLLVDGSQVTLIDFDDCGVCWFMYDFAAAISFFEDSPAVPELKRRWLAGYTPIRALSPEDIGVIDTMVLLRRMALLAFLGSHPETDLAREHRERFAENTVKLARKIA